MARIPKHIRSRMMADAINQLPYLPKETKEGKQIRASMRKLNTLYKDMD